MPAKSAKMQRFMGMCAHNPQHAYGECPPKDVAREFARKPKGGYRKRKRTSMPKKDKNGFY